MEKDNYIGMLLDNRYKVKQLIGVGGMAYVFTAEDTQENRTVAVKILKDEFASNHEFVKKFINESKVLSGLSHPSIVEVFDVSFDGNPKFMVMEYIDGITLKEYMETANGALSWKDSVHFTVQILRALQHAHARGVIHRDIKPHNIMLFTDGTVKVMDFGISKVAREEVKSSTEHALGSVHYISPEQAQGQSTDEKSDIYSLGCVLYEMLTGQKPFDSDNPITVALMHSQEVAPTPTSINPDIPRGLEQIIIKAMEKKPAKRFQSAAEMIQALQAFRKNPDIVFNYDEEEEYSDENAIIEPVPIGVNANGESSAYSNTGELPIANNGNANPPVEEEVINEDDIEVERSLFLPILTGITLVIILVAVIFVASLIKNTFANDSWKSPEFTMPNLVGLDYQEAKTMYPELDISISAEQYSETYEKDTIMEQSVDEGILCKSGVAVDIIISKGVKMITIPDVTNFDYQVAEQTLKNEGLLVEMKFQWDDDVDKDYVVKTEPSAKEEVAPGTKVVLYVSQGRYVSTVKVPDLTGMTLDAAKAMIESKDLTWKLVYQHSNQAKDIVVDQDIQPETEVDNKTEITIYLSDGVAPTNSVNTKFTIPDNASGTFKFSIYINTTLSQEKSGIVASMGNGSFNMVLEGNGTQSVTVMVTNEGNGKTAEYGRYNIDFDTGDIEVISSKAEQAFIDIDGIVVQTEQVTQQQIVYNEALTESAAYEAPAETEAVQQSEAVEDNNSYQEDYAEPSDDYSDDNANGEDYAQ